MLADVSIRLWQGWVGQSIYLTTTVHRVFTLTMASHFLLGRLACLVPETHATAPLRPIASRPSESSRPDPSLLKFSSDSRYMPRFP